MSTLILPTGLAHNKVDFIRDFYAISDDQSKLEEYVNAFSQDGTIIMGAAPPAKGAEEIRTLRGNMWSAIATRLHRPMGVFPFDQAANEVMIYGNVDMGLKNGKKVDNVEWSARMVFAQGSKDVKMEFYQVYMDANRVKDAISAA